MFGHGDVAVLYADNPLIRRTTLRACWPAAGPPAPASPCWRCARPTRPATAGW